MSDGWARPADSAIGASSISIADSQEKFLRPHLTRNRELITATINGRPNQFEEGVSILEAARALGIEIPTLCNDERLRPIGSCRLCLVQVDGKPRPLTACHTPLADGMVISTHTAALEWERCSLLKMLAQDHPGEGLRKAPDKPFYRYALQYGLTESDFNGSHETQLLDDSHPYIHVDMSQCIVCYRCVRICAEVQGQFVWLVLKRGHDTRIVPNSMSTLLESSCVSCGACVDTCPSGALEDKSVLTFGLPASWTRTTCPYCGTGCEMSVGIRDRQIVSIRPLLDAPVSRGHLCVKGRYAFDFINAADRITEPMIRKDGDWHRVTWEEAISFTANQLKSILHERGELPRTKICARSYRHEQRRLLCPSLPYAHGGGAEDYGWNRRRNQFL